MASTIPTNPSICFGTISSKFPSTHLLDYAGRFTVHESIISTTYSPTNFAYIIGDPNKEEAASMYRSRYYNTRTGLIFFYRITPTIKSLSINTLVHENHKDMKCHNVLTLGADLKYFTLRT